MKKQRIQMLILLIVLVLCIGGFLFAKSLPDDEGENSPINQISIEEAIAEETEESMEETVTEETTEDVSEETD